MATYPETPYPQEMDIEIEWKTIVAGLGSGSEQRKQKWTFPKYNVRIPYSSKSLDDPEMQTLWDFYLARKGPFEAFYIYDFTLDVTMDYNAQYVGVGDGSTTIFDIPGRSTSAQAIYFDEVDQAAGWSILTGGGASSSDRVSFSSAPAAGVIISCDFTGYLRMRCRFADDRLSRDSFLGIAFGFGIKLKGLAAD
jgi:hypothetical protein